MSWRWEQPEQAPRQLVWHITGTAGYFISVSSVYRILKSFDLVTSPAFRIITAGEEFEHKTARTNEMWQTDFTQFKVIRMGWYYLCTVLDDFSRYIPAWRLVSTMASDDVEKTLDIARTKTDLTEPIMVKHRSQLLLDNGPSLVSEELCKYLDKNDIQHVRGLPYHPQTQGKIERYHRSMKNVVKPESYYFPWNLELAILSFVVYYNHQRYHELLDNLTSGDVYCRRTEEVKPRRQQIKHPTLRDRHRHNLQLAFHSL